ncbi:CHAP domain-containing protein [Enterococcus faecium]|nr:CHAP domain-containing protein [Enterococcus faecium]
MAVNMDGAIAYAKRFVGKVPYSMTGPRDPERGTADCSSFVYWAVVRGGGGKQWQHAWAPSTVTMPQWLYANGFKLIADNKSWNMQKGDIVIWGEPGNSYGSAGHTGICIDNQNWIEETGYIMNVGIFNHDQRLAQAGYPYWQVFRYQGPTPSKPAPAPKPTTPSQHAQAVAKSPAVHQGNAWGKLDKLEMPKKDTLRVAGWLVPDKPNGPIGAYAYVIIMEHGTNKELTRIQSAGIKRADVKKQYGYAGGAHLGFDVTLNVGWLKGKKVDVIFRRCNKSNGEGAVNDVRIKDIYLTIV